MFDAPLKSSCKLWTESVSALEDAALTANVVVKLAEVVLDFPKFQEPPSNSRL
jgi:hypothetical protein